jgi:dTDP-4-dehydrorhamnose reductase
MNYILGGDGFIGSHIGKTFNATPVIHDLRESAEGKFDYIQKDDVVFHAAHFGSIDECATNISGTRDVNVLGTIRFFEELKKRNAFPVYFSTNMVFSGGKPFYSEKETPSPVTEYGKQKREVEGYIERTFERYLIIRMTKVYGKGSRSFIDSFIEALTDNKEVRAIADMYSAPIYIEDVLTALQALLMDKRTGICHLSGPKERLIDEIALLAANHLKVDESLVAPISVYDLSLAENRPVHNSLSCDTLQIHGYSIPRDIPEILQTFYI